MFCADWSDARCSQSDYQRHVLAKPCKSERLLHEVPANKCEGRRSRGSSSTSGSTSLRSTGIVVVLTGRLEKVHGDRVRHIGQVLRGNQGASDECHKEDEKSEVKDRKANDSSPAKLGLLERVDGRTNLTAAVVISNGTMDRE